MKFFDDTVLEDAIDIHIHAGPDHMKRYADCITLSEEARACGMRAYVAKAPLMSTVGEALAANLVEPEVEAIGSLTLNGATGGLSPRAVVAAIRAGAKVIWLPTIDALYSYEKAVQGHWIDHYVFPSTFGYQVEYLTVTKPDGSLKEEMQEILRLCKENDIALCSGHISPAECLAIAKEAAQIGFQRFEITHANAWTEDFTLDVMKELAGYGAFISLAYGVCSPRNGRQKPEEIVKIIQEVGAEHCIMMTDYGQITSPSPAQGLRIFYYLMKTLGVPTDELDLMVKTNPAKLIRLG